MRLNILIVLLICVCFQWNTHGQNRINGPMTGFVTDSTVTIWLQTDTNQSVYLTYHKENASSSTAIKTEEHITEKSQAFATKFTLPHLQPATKYIYNVWLDGKQIALPKELKFQTQPAKNQTFDFCVATGSCSCLRDKTSKYPDKFYQIASGYGIFNKMAKRNPDYVAWLGDNVYLRNGEWESKEGVQYRYTHTRSLSKIQRLLQTGSHFATWDDHDYGANNGNSLEKNKDFAKECFDAFWANPPQNHTQKGIYYSYNIGDVSFFMTDDRYFRSPQHLPDNADKAFLGKEQLDWLLSELEKSTANFKFIAIGTQYLNPNTHPYKEGYWKDYQTEARFLLDEIVKRKINGVFFLTGDVHHTVLSKLTPQGFYPVYDLTVSAFTSAQNPFFGRKNPLKVKGTFVGAHNFAILSFSGEAKNRQMKIEIRNKWGIRRWKKTIFAKDLTL